MSALEQIDAVGTRGWAKPVRVRLGRHRAADQRARLTLRRMFYFARHLRRS